MNTETLPAVGASVECHVRPVLWATWLDDDAGLMTEADKAARKLGSDGFDVPLYDQSALDAAVTAERERCAKIVDIPPGIEAWEVIGGEEGLTMLRELAARIRSGGQP